MQSLLSITQVLIAIAMIAIILIQRGPGAAAGSGFGAGASGTVFGARGSGSFLTRSTGVLATGFFLVSMVMAVMASSELQRNQAPDLGVMETATAGQPADSADVPSLPEIQEPEVVPVPEADGVESPEPGQDQDGG